MDVSAELIDKIVAWIRENSPEPDTAAAEITVDTDLLTSGILDSLALVNLIEYIELTANARLELMDVDPENFATLRGLLRAVQLPLNEERSNAS